MAGDQSRIRDVGVRTRAEIWSPNKESTKKANVFCSLIPVALKIGMAHSDNPISYSRKMYLHGVDSDDEKHP